MKYSREQPPARVPEADQVSRRRVRMHGEALKQVATGSGCSGEPLGSPEWVLRTHISHYSFRVV
jgi:hypothetical protein